MRERGNASAPAAARGCAPTGGGWPPGAGARLRAAAALPGDRSSAATERTPLARGRAAAEARLGMSSVLTTW